MKIKYLLLATISGAVVALDQLTKIYIHTHYHLGQSRIIIRGFFNITYVRNFGAAFGFFSTASRNFREPFFILIPIVALMVILFIMRSIQDHQKIFVMSLSLIFGGAVGNYVDRLRFQFVIDFLDFHWKEFYHWPAFNVADSAIVCGVAVLLVHILSQRSNQQDLPKPDTNAGAGTNPAGTNTNSPLESPPAKI